jgi:hypothetical protein
MADTNDRLWREFEDLGEETVRKQLAEHIYSEGRERHARQWLEYRDSLESSASKTPNSSHRKRS